MSKCNKLNECFPPDISGEFRMYTEAVGNYKGITYNLENPLKISGHTDFKQKGIFVERNFNHEHIVERDDEFGVWKKKYDKNLKFNGWELYIASGLDDDSFIIVEPTKVRKNKVLRAKSTYIRSGFSENNPLQKPLVGSSTYIRKY